jgi:hypothetical protein
MQEAMQTALPMPSLPFVANSRKLALAAARRQVHAFKAVMGYQIEALSFLKLRFEADVKLVDDLVDSAEFNDAFDIIAAFIQNAVTEYASEAGKMASISSKLTSATAKGMPNGTEEAVEDLLAAAAA